MNSGFSLMFKCTYKNKILHTKGNHRVSQGLHISKILMTLTQSRILPSAGVHALLYYSLVLVLPTACHKSSDF